LAGTLSAFEVMWPEFYSFATQGRGESSPLRDAHAFYLLVESQGSDQNLDGDRFEAWLSACFEAEIIADAVVSKSEREAEKLWAIRDASGELRRIIGHCVNFDISIPTGNIGDFAADCRGRLSAALAGSKTLVFGHIADSNIHLSCQAASGPAADPIIEHTVYAAVRDWGGSISAEHGIGTAKREYLAYTRNPEEMGLMRRLKASLDPKNILNPGKIL